MGHECASAGTADLLRGDEVRLLEQPDVLLHPGQRHAEGLGELADRRAAAAEPFEHGAPGRVGERREGTVDGRGILNHWVQYYRALRKAQIQTTRLPPTPWLTRLRAVPRAAAAADPVRSRGGPRSPDAARRDERRDETGA